MLTRKMKDSGIEWIGEIPEDWEVVKLKNIITFINGFAFKSNQFTTEKENTNKVITISSFNSYKINKDKITFSKEKIENLCNYKLKEKDILFAMSGGTVGKNLYIDDLQGETYYINQRVGIIRSKFNKLIFFNLNNKMFDEYTKLLSAGSAQPNISGSDIGKFRIALPPSEKIRKLSYVLDNLDSHVNNIITQTQQSIEELKKYKQSLITEAVTKGLDPNAEMKDSGIEWIGKIPKLWSVRKISNYFSQVKDKNDELEEENLLSLSYGSIIRRNINSTDGLLPANFKNYNIVKFGDIVLRMTDLQNDKVSLRTGFVTEDGIITSAYITIRTDLDNNVLPKYIQLLLHSFDIYKGFYGMGSGVRQNVTYNDIKKIEIIVPPLNEQRQIVSYLDEQTARIDKLIEDKTKVIEELEDYKKSLIYEYVTGKKEV